MNKVVLIVMLAMPIVSFSQVRNLPGMSSVGIGVGLVRYGLQANAEYERILFPKLSIKGELQYQMSEYKTIKFENYNAFAGASYKVFNLWESIYFKLGLGVTGSYNYIRDLDKISDSGKKGGFNYGLYIEPEADIFIYKSLILFINGKQVYQIGDYLGHWYWVASTGLKVQF